MRHPTHRGMTLVELMVVVAIVGVLASVAVFMYTRSIAKARANEVQAVFAEFRLKFEQWAVERSTFVTDAAMSSNEDDIFPVPAAKRSASTAGHPAFWDDLKVNVKSDLWCGYAFFAGAAGDDTGIGTHGAAIMEPGGGSTAAPATNWWYGVAQCPFNGKTYATSFQATEVAQF
jgi:prepilin-type N-terminal cleavage/methylation domain-containing protein